MSLTISSSSQSKVLIPGTCRDCLHLHTSPLDKSILTSAIHGAGEGIHRRRQTCQSDECPRDLDVSAPRHQHTQSLPFCENSDSSPSSQFHSSDSNSCEPDSHLNPELFQNPPPPSDLLALHELWGHVQAYRSVRKTVSNRSLI